MCDKKRILNRKMKRGGIETWMNMTRGVVKRPGCMTRGVVKYRL